MILIIDINKNFEDLIIIINFIIIMKFQSGVLANDDKRLKTSNS